MTEKTKIEQNVVELEENQLDAAGGLNFTKIEYNAQQQSANDRPMESLSLNYTKIAY